MSYFVIDGLFCTIFGFLNYKIIRHHFFREIFHLDKADHMDIFSLCLPALDCIQEYSYNHSRNYLDIPITGQLVFLYTEKIMSNDLFRGILTFEASGKVGSLQEFPHVQLKQPEQPSGHFLRQGHSEHYKSNSSLIWQSLFIKQMPL